MNHVITIGDLVWVGVAVIGIVIVIALAIGVLALFADSMKD
jgi:hypothetical protein